MHTTLRRLCLLAGIVLSSCTTSSQPESNQIDPNSRDPGQVRGKSAVTIYRDTWGVPHIYAKTEEMGYFGLGYAQAEDQLIRLLGMVHWSQGRRAALQGANYLSGDISQRRWLHVEEGQAGVAHLLPQVKNNYEHFIDGIERYMADFPERVPAWAPELQVSDLLTLNRAIFWIAYAAVEGPAECLSEVDELVADAARLAADFERGASNGWALAPARTADGTTMVLSDPHLEFNSPVYYEFRMDAGPVKVSGFAMGALLWQLHNRNVSWAMTTGSPDMWDCYAVNVDPDNPYRYQFDGQWIDMVTRNERFEVAGADPVTHTYYYTQHNGVLSPVLARKGDTAYAVSVSQMHDGGAIDNELWQMSTAASIGQLQQAMRSLAMFPQNITAGDKSGSLWYIRAGKTPIRPTGYDFSKAVPGNSSATAWLGFHPLEDMVQILNPDQGYLQNNNVSPDRMFDQGNIDVADYPPELFNDVAGRTTTRGQRSIEVLSRAHEFTTEEALALVFDERWVIANHWIAALQYGLDNYPWLLKGHTQETRHFVRLLLDFDGVAAADSESALAFYYWRQDMHELLMQPQFSRFQNLPWNQEDFDEAFTSGLLDQAELAAAARISDLGTHPSTLGDVFRVGRAPETFPVGGETIDGSSQELCVADISPLCERTMRAFASAPADENGERLAARGSSVTRFVVFSDPIQSWSLHLYGQSENPDSLHYNDQSRLASEHRLKPTWFRFQDLQKHIESTTQLNYTNE